MVVALWVVKGMPVSEVIQDGVEGILIPMNAPDLLADKVLKLLERPEARVQFGRAARRRALLYDQRLTLNRLSELLNA